jgi:hypothetical protein
MPGAGAAGSGSEQECEDDALEILKSFIEHDEVPRTDGVVAVNDIKLFDPVEHQFLSDHSPLTKEHTEDRPLVARESVIHSGDTDSSDDEYSDYGKTIKKMLVEKQKPYKGDEVPINCASSWQKVSVSAAPSALRTEKVPQVSQPSLDVYSDSVFGIRMM